MWLRHLGECFWVWLFTVLFYYFAFYSFYGKFMHGSFFLDSFANCNRRPSVHRFVGHCMMLLDYISIRQWQKRIVANSFVCVDLVLPLVNLLFCCWSEEVGNCNLFFLFLDLVTMQGSDKRILGYICDACKRRFASRFAYDQHRRSKILQGTPCFTAVEQLSELVATRRANMSTAMLRMATHWRAYPVQSVPNFASMTELCKLWTYPVFFGIIKLIMYIMHLNPGWFPEPTRV